jgi:hypothetical protein
MTEIAVPQAISALLRLVLGPNSGLSNIKDFTSGLKGLGGEEVEGLLLRLLVVVCWLVLLSQVLIRV